MKIVFITSAFCPSIGGVETHVLELSRELIKLGHTITVVTEYREQDWQNKRKSDSEAKKLKSVDKSSYFVHKKLDQIDIYYFKFGQPSFFKKFKIWYIFLKERNLFKDVGIIHCHDVFIWYLPLRFLFFQKRVFTTFHGYETVFPPKDKAIWIRRLSEKLSYGNICIGDFIKKWYGTIPDYVLYGAVKPISSRNPIPKLRKKKLRIVLVGRLEKDMGIHIYKETLKKMRDTNKEVEFVACGGGTFSSELEQYGTVLGFVPKIQTYLKTADMVFASSYLIMLQALQLGKPVFSVYTNPLKHDYLSDSPFRKFVSITHTSDELVKQILSYTPKPRKLQQARTWANSQTWEKVAQTYIELWNKK